MHVQQQSLPSDVQLLAQDQHRHRLNALEDAIVLQAMEAVKMQPPCAATGRPVWSSPVVVVEVVSNQPVVQAQDHRVLWSFQYALHSIQWHRSNRMAVMPFQALQKKACPDAEEDKMAAAAPEIPEVVLQVGACTAAEEDQMAAAAPSVIPAVQPPNDTAKDRWVEEVASG